MIVTCLSASGAQAKWGFQAGANFTTHKSLKSLNEIGPNVFHTATGYSAGFIYDLNLGLGLGVNTGLMFIKRNIEHESSGSKTLDRYSSIELPVNLKYQISLPIVSPFIIGGPYFDYGLRKKQWGYKIDYGNWRDKMSGGFTLGVGVDLVKTIRAIYQCDWGVNSFKKPGHEKFGSSSSSLVPVPYRAKTLGSRISIGVFF